MAEIVENSSTQRGLSWAALVLGVLIFLVPFATGVTGGLYANDIVVGIVVVILAAICIWAVTNSRMTLAWLALINAVIGIWTVVAAYYYTGLNSTVMASNVVLGLVLLIVAGWSCIMAFRAGAFGTGKTAGAQRRMGGA
ncbi:MAG: SPW repeat domain-containing protein [Thermoplasmatota archaeon]